MGQLTVTVGPVSSDLSFDNARGATIIDNYIAAYGGPTEAGNQAKLDWFVTHLASHVQTIHLGYVRAQAIKRIETDIDQAAANAERDADRW